LVAFGAIFDLDLLFSFQCAEFDLIFSNQQIHIFAVLQLCLISLFDFIIASADFGLNPFSAQFGDFRPFVQGGSDHSPSL
jgi:hypothetical protein